MKKEAQIKYLLEDFLKSHPIKAPLIKVIIDLDEYSYAVNYCLN